MNSANSPQSEDVLPEANARLRQEIHLLKERNRTLLHLVQRRAAMIAEAQETLLKLETERASLDAEFAQLNKKIA